MRTETPQGGGFAALAPQNRRPGAPLLAHSVRKAQESVAIRQTPGHRKKEAEQFLDLACLTYGNDSTVRIERAKQMLAAQPALAEVTAYTDAATANVGALRRLLAEDARRASAEGGPRNWPPLLYLCYSRLTEQLPEADAVAAARLLLEHGADPNAYFMWGGTYRFTALTGAMGEGEGGGVSDFCDQYDERFAQKYGRFRLRRIESVAGRFGTCGDYRHGVARIRCTNPECGHDHFRPFSCLT